MDRYIYVGAKDRNNPDAERERKQAEALKPIIDRLEKMAAERVSKRKPTEKRWLEDHRQLNGQYDESVDRALVADRERSAVFINITRAKTNAWSARLYDMLFPNDERNWGIDPTPVPELTKQAREYAEQAEKLEGQAQQTVDEHNADVEQGGQGNPEKLTIAHAAAQEAAGLREQEKRAQHVIEAARKRCEAMQRVIDDQLTESRYPGAARDVIDDATRVGVGIIKGPIIDVGGRGAWVDLGGGDYALQPSTEIKPKFRRVSYWHFFPDHGAANMDECEDVFERHLPNKKLLRKMAKDIGFHEEAVRKLLKDGPQAYSSASTDLNFMQELRSIEGSSSSSNDTVSDFRERYVVWEWHGQLELQDVAAMVRAMGRGEDADRLERDGNPMSAMMVRVFFCCGELLRIEEDYVFDSGALPYSVFQFEKAEASIFGAVGVPRLMKHEQHMLNSAVRMMMDNAALAVSPQVIVDKEQIAPENGSWKLAPRKIWQRIRGALSGQQAVAPAFELHEIPMNQQMLAAIVDMALKFVDEAVSMPLIAQGEQGAHVTRTSSGMAMLFNSANVNFRRVVKNYDDDITTPLITRVYDFNMQFSDRQEIKGDMQVEARGTSVLLVREVQADQLMQILMQWSVHPIMGVGFRAYHCMRMVLQAMSINPDDLLVDEEEYMQKLKAMAESGGKDDPEQVRAQTQMQIAQMDAQARLKVSESNERIAEIRAQTEFAKLAQDHNLSMAQIQAMFQTAMVDAETRMGIEHMRTASKERSLAAEIAIEQRNAEQDRAAGMMPTGSGGSISLGARPAGEPR